jgi:hemerythrin superfamily protein
MRLPLRDIIAASSESRVFFLHSLEPPASRGRNVSTRTIRTGGSMTMKKQDAIALLKADHKKVKELFDQFEEAKNSDQKNKFAEEAIQELRVHSVVEEEIFYPATRQALGQSESELMDEAEEEHRVAKTIIEELCESDMSDEHFEAKFMVLAENVRHHIKEEESEMFKEARSADGLDLDALGERMLERKAELMEDEAVLESAERKSKVQPYQELASV